MNTNIFEGRYGVLPRLFMSLVRGQTAVDYMEIGTHSGLRAAALCRGWMNAGGRRKFRYTGFDLFDNADTETYKHEFLKTTPAPSLGVAMTALDKAGAIVALHGGDTRETLPRFVAERQGKYVPDVVFVDGGHSLETIASDWRNVAALIGPKSAVVFDDYFDGDTGLGCKTLIDRLIEENVYDVELGADPDVVPDSGRSIRTAVVRLRA